ncbi:MAG TPA: hypothetical protein VH054_06225 [Polyangiaceae bacterium]|jgi:hypothetical protein|nr:hypothetical protein [Polyangiaceae bacterium]
MAETRQAARRPWYLVLALLVCSGIGACESTAGWTTVELYRGHIDDRSHDMTREDNAKAVATSFQKMVGALDEERPRAFPLAVGELVLGIAVFVFAAAAMTGRGGARRALVQLMVAETVLVGALFFVTPKFRAAETEWLVAQQTGQMLEKGQSEADVRPQMAALRVFRRGLGVALLVLRTSVAGLVLLALTRQRARAYYDAQGEREAEG